MMINLSKNNKGSGIAVVVYGVVLMIMLIFVAINMLNAKVIETAYNSLRDAVLAASSGSVMHLLTTETGSTTEQQKVMDKDDGRSKYDVYLQLALGYIINRKTTGSEGSKTISAETNNFIKLDHKKVVNSTMALLDDAIIRNRGANTSVDIGDTSRFKICMFFIEPYYDNNYEKVFDIIMYHNGMYDKSNTSEWVLDVTQGKADIATGNTMREIYENIEWCIQHLVNTSDKMKFNDYRDNFTINLNANNEKEMAGFVRALETRPYYIIVVKDFALPTVFDGVETNTEDKNVFTFLSGNGSLNTPMCALNSGRVERRLD